MLLVFNVLNYVLQELESEAQYRQAEQHFVDGGDWKAAVNMHRAKNMWDDAYRVSLKTCGLGYCPGIGSMTSEWTLVIIHRLPRHTVGPMQPTRWPTSGPRLLGEKVPSNCSQSLGYLKPQWTMLLITSEREEAQLLA